MRTLIAAFALCFPVFAQPAGPVAERLDAAARATRLLRECARRVEAAEAGRWCPEPDDPADRPAGGGHPAWYARRADVAAYEEARPWTRRHRPPQPGALEADWPTAAEAPALRAQLGHADPVRRGLAAEALATLHDPADLPAIAALLADGASAAPELAHNHLNIAMLPPRGLDRSVAGDSSRSGGRAPVDTLSADQHTEREATVYTRSWHDRSVADYARRALARMTGETLSAAAFPAWQARTGTPRHALWYWERRLEREILAAENVAPVDHAARWAEAEAARAAEIAGRREAALARIAAELAALPAEVEAKVRLLAVHPRGADPEITGPERRYWAVYDSTRLPAARLLELLEGSGLWADLEWTEDRYNRLVERIALAADRHFDAPQASRLLGCPAVSGRSLWWSGEAALAIGASRVLPAAPPEHLDAPLTRDGVLRAAARSADPFVAGWTASELIRVALATNWPFLRELAFGEPDGSHVPNRCTKVVRALGRARHDAVSRACLRELLLDPRFSRFWVIDGGAAMGRDAVRQAAFAAVNNHAGREVLGAPDRAALSDPARATQHLPALRARVEEALR